MNALFLLKDIDGTYYFRDKEMKDLVCFDPNCDLTKRNKYVVFNCARYKAEWID